MVLLWMFEHMGNCGVFIGNCGVPKTQKGTKFAFGFDARNISKYNIIKVNL